MMRVHATRLALGMLIAVSAGACAVGPKYRRQELPPETRITAAQRNDTTRVFFDSLYAAHRPGSAINETDAALAAARWSDVIRDTVLLRLVDIALHNNQDLQVAQARIREFRADVGIARAPLLPTLNGNVSTSTNQVVLGSLPPTSYRANIITGNVSWEVDFWGRIRRNVQAANADLDAQVAAERATTLSLISDVATGYLEMVELDQEHMIATNTLQTRQATLAIARQRFNRGLTSELDVRQFEAQLAETAAALAQSEQQRSAAERNLNVLLGQMPSRVARGRSLADVLQTITVPDSVPAPLLERRPDLQIAERAIAASTARVGAAEAAKLPPISIIGSYGAQAASPDNLFSSNARIYQLQAGFSVPIFNNGRLSNQVRAERARTTEARANYEQTALNAMREASDALTGIRTTRDEVAANASRVASLRAALNLAQLRYNAGLAPYLDLLDAQRSLFSAELALSQAELRQLTAVVVLYKAIGGTWATS